MIHNVSFGLAIARQSAGGGGAAQLLAGVSGSTDGQQNKRCRTAGARADRCRVRAQELKPTLFIGVLRVFDNVFAGVQGAPGPQIRQAFLNTVR